MFVPSSAGTFGSGERLIKLISNKSPNQSLVHNAYLDVKKTRMKYMSQPSEPCDSDRTIKTTDCIAQFIQSQIGCDIKVQGARETNNTSWPPCNSTSQLQKFAFLSGKLQYATASDIYDMTGCLSACEKDKFDIRTSQMIKKSFQKPNPTGRVTLTVHISMSDTSYVQEQEYIIYDVNSFIADVGGYMGLLLGCSILSLFDEVESVVKKLFKAAIRKWYKRKLMNEEYNITGMVTSTRIPIFEIP